METSHTIISEKKQTCMSDLKELKGVVDGIEKG
jgi:hypothetical protein